MARKTTTLDKRRIAASAKTAGALSLFSKAADELEAAASEHDAVALEHFTLHYRHGDAAKAAESARDESLEAARKIRELIGA